MSYYICHSVLVPGVGMLLVEKNCGCSIRDKTPFQQLQSVQSNVVLTILTSRSNQLTSSPSRRGSINLGQLSHFQKTHMGKGGHMMGYYVSPIEIVRSENARTKYSQIHGLPEGRPWGEDTQCGRSGSS